MFFQRHAAAVRHTINILANFAQLKVVSTTSAVAPDSNAGVRDGIETVKGMLIGKAKKSGFSVYAIKLLLRLYEDFFVSQSACADFEKKALVAALLLIFSEINGFDFVKRDFILDLTKANAQEMESIEDIIRASIGCVSEDPRYLTEEGFVRALYVI